jgi:hypothetical protein
LARKAWGIRNDSPDDGRALVPPPLASTLV